MTIEELIERLEKAEGPDRWVDARIDAMFRIGSAKMQGDGTGYDWAWDNFPVWAHHKQARGRCGVQHDNGDLGLIWDSMAFTSSIDAAVALAEKVLKVYRLDICMDPSGVSAKVVWWPKGLVECDIQIRTEGMGATPAASIIIAVLKAYPERRP